MRLKRATKRQHTTVNVTPVSVTLPLRYAVRQCLTLKQSGPTTFTMCHLKGKVSQENISFKKRTVKYSILYIELCTDNNWHACRSKFQANRIYVVKRTIYIVTVLFDGRSQNVLPVNNPFLAQQHLINQCFESKSVLDRIQRAPRSGSVFSRAVDPHSL